MRLLTKIILLYFLILTTSVCLLDSLVFAQTDGLLPVGQRSEIFDQRTLNSKIFSEGDGITFTMEAHTGHIHYKPKGKAGLEEIDTTLIPTPHGWEMRKASYELKIPRYADDWITFINSFVFDPRTQEEHNLPEEIINMRLLGARHIKGKINNVGEWAGKG